MSIEDTEFLGGGEGVVTLPLPCGEPEQVMVIELLLLGCCKVNKRTKKKDKYDQMDQPETYTSKNLKFESENQLRI